MAGLLGDYWDLDATMAEGEKVATQFETNAVRLGFLDPVTAADGELPSGTRIEMPMWIAKTLSTKRHCRTFTPAYLSRKYKNLVEAQAREMDLRSLSPFYFEMAQMTMSLSGAVESKAVDSMLLAMVERQKEILNQAQHAENEDMSKFVAKLTALEMHLYDNSAECAREFDRWRKLEINRVQAEFVNGKRRRKI